MQQEGETARSMARSLKTAVGYAAAGLAAVLTAVVLSVLFSVAPVSDGRQGIAVALKPAYLFAIPEDGDFVVYEGESDLSEGKRLKTGRYDGDRITMDRVRGKIIIVIPM